MPKHPLKSRPNKEYIHNSSYSHTSRDIIYKNLIKNIINFKDYEEKKKWYLENTPFGSESDDFDEETVTCIICNSKFNIMEFTGIKEDGKNWIMCKNYPVCHGSLIKFI
jgi:hypothetical protein